jgi:hypothetical protein
VDERDDMPDSADDIVCRKELTHGSMGSLQFRDHLAGLDLTQQLLQVPVEYDGIVLHDPIISHHAEGVYTLLCGN